MPGVEKIMDSEYEIMKVLWQENPLTANEIYTLLEKKKNWRKSTVLTLINRLVEKGAIKSEKRGVYFYTPLVSESEYKDYHAGHFIQKLFNGSAKNMLAYFCGNNGITLEDLNDLKLMIENKEE